MYKVIFTYTHTEEVVVNAQNEREAEIMAYSAETTRNEDDSLHDVYVREHEDEPEFDWFST